MKPGYVLAIILILCLSSPAEAQEETSSPLPVSENKRAQSSLKEALKQTYLNNPTIESARAELFSIHENLPQAQAGWKPRAAAQADTNVADIEGSNFGAAGRGSPSGTVEKNIGLNITQPLFRGGRTVAASREARERITAARYGVLSVEQDVLLQALTVYMDVIRDQALLDLAKENAAVIEEQYTATNERFEVGELTRTDVSQARARLSDARANIINARGALENSRGAYKQVIGTVPQNLKTPDIALDLPASLDEALAMAKEQAPRNLQAQHEYGATEYQVDEVSGELLPEISAQADWSRSYDPQPGYIPESTSRTAAIVADIPLYEAGATRSRVRQAKHLANQAYIEIRESERRVRADIIEAWSNLDTAKAEIDARRDQVEAAEVAREGVYAEEQVGNRTVLDTLDADQELLDAEVSLVTARRNEIVAMFALAAILGKLTPEYLGFPEAQIDYDAHLGRVQRKVLSTDISNK